MLLFASVNTIRYYYIVFFLISGMHCTEKRHQTDVRYEVYEQKSMYRKRRPEKRST